MTDLFVGSVNSNIINWIQQNIQLDYSKIPLYFEALEDGNVNLTKIGSLDEISLLYSFDNKNWNDWEYETGTDLKTGEKLYLKSKTDNGYFSKDYDNYYSFKFSSGSKINVYGNIMSLLYNDFIDKKELLTEYCFFKLFRQCEIIDASKLILPAIKLSEHCYQYMFEYCTNLVFTPKLPATILSAYCYNYMFKNCINICIPPKLPAITLANCCYTGMFYYCISLTTIPKLPATIMYDSCYAYMFWQCILLTNTFQLPATTLARACYFMMFKQCDFISELHYPKIIKDNEIFISITDSPQFGATNATVYYDL